MSISSTNSKFETFFSKLFSQIILNNEIVATIIYVVSKKLQYQKNKIDNILNTDI
jgi:hypothetical protein